MISEPISNQFQPQIPNGKGAPRLHKNDSLGPNMSMNVDKSDAYPTLLHQEAAPSAEKT